MEYISSVISNIDEFLDNTCDVIVEVIASPILRKITIGAFSFFITLGVSASESKSYLPFEINGDIENNLTTEESVADIVGTKYIPFYVDSGKRIFLSRYCCLPFDQVQDNMGNLNSSFLSHFDENMSDMYKFFPTYEQIRNAVCNLDIKDQYVDISRRQKFVDFNLYLDDDITVSITKYISNHDDNVMFTISRHGRTLVVNQMPLFDLINEIYGMMDDLTKVSKDKA